MLLKPITFSVFSLEAISKMDGHCEGAQRPKQSPKFNEKKQDCPAFWIPLRAGLEKAELRQKTCRRTYSVLWQAGFSQ
ncbi:MAG: hypothetical protein Q8L88_12570 [Bacteroidota bacterium]|nr:hypothetical protein [Bacteroidota bacterium]